MKNYPEAMQFTGVSIIRLDADLYFANADTFRDALLDATSHAKVIVFDASILTAIDLQVSFGVYACQASHHGFSCLPLRAFAHFWRP